VKDLLKKRGIKAEEIDAIICATITPDMHFPSTANLVCEELGIRDIPSFDLSAACSGFLYAMEVGAGFIKTGLHKKVVVIGADKMSAIMDYTDRNNCIIFGDGAGAALLEPGSDEFGIIDSVLKSDPVGKDLIYMKAGGSKYPASHASIENREHYFVQDGKSVFKYAVTRMADVAGEIMKRNDLHGDDVAWLIPHQANRRIIEATANRMDIGMDKVTMNIEYYGNTTGGTIPLCLWEWEKTFKKGDNLVFAAFGAGFTWGAAYVKWAY
ncbi:MAG: ketoacyl-ACP synthase III, partial [Saprospiraceae bacterium]|nr:ketoacyl-ACP synthase III [Saprospiraceae bacterium]